MGIVRQHIRLSNPYEPDLEEIDALALVDSGAAEMCIPEQIARQLKLKHAGSIVLHMADGRREETDLMMTLRVSAFGLSWNGQVAITGDEVLLGAPPMQSMGLLIDPRNHRIYPDPASPNVPTALAKGVR